MQIRDEQVDLLRWSFRQGDAAGLSRPHGDVGNKTVRDYAVFVGSQIRRAVLEHDPEQHPPLQLSKAALLDYAGQLEDGAFDRELAELFSS